MAAEILTAEAGGRRIGFRHQTLFDFVRARAFVAGEASLADHALARQDTLFVRPTVWSALNYLRGAGPAGYRREFGRLWAAPTLRAHLRLLLTDFLAQAPDPSDPEARWLLPVLDDPARRRRALLGMAGSPGWFDRIQARLPLLMRGDDRTAWETTAVLRRALTFARGRALDLVEAHWLDPLRPAHVLAVIEDAGSWDERALAIAEAIARSDGISGPALRKLVSNVSQSAPESAPRLVATQLRTGLDRARANDGSGPPESEERRRVRLERLLGDRLRWYGLTEVARRAPAAFMRAVWPPLLEIAAALAWPPDEDTDAYRAVRSLEFVDQDRDSERARTLSGVLAAAAEAWAEQDGNGFLAFAAECWPSDLMPVHRLLARGLTVLAPTHPGAVLGYLLADRRRLVLGDYSDSYAETCRLIGAVAAHLGDAEMDRLARTILAWRRYANRPDDGPERRRWTLHRNRHCRRRLLTAIPVEHRPARAARLLREEARLLGPAREPGPRVTVQTTGSPMTAAQMARASDADILGLFDELVDATG